MTEHKRSESEIQLLQTLNQTSSEAPDFQAALAAALASICEVTNWDYGEAWIPYKDGTLLELSPAYYINTHRRSAYVPALEQFRLCSEAFILSPGAGLPGRVWSSGQPEWVYDVSVQSETYFLRNQIALAFGVKTGFGVPILTNHQVLAVLVFFMLSPCSEDKRLVELTRVVATQLGVLLSAQTHLGSPIACDGKPVSLPTSVVEPTL